MLSNKLIPVLVLMKKIVVNLRKFLILSLNWHKEVNYLILSLSLDDLRNLWLDTISHNFSLDSVTAMDLVLLTEI